MKTLLKLFIGFFFILYALLGLIFCFDSPDTLTNIELLVGYIVILCGIYYIIKKVRNKKSHTSLRDVGLNI